MEDTSILRQQVILEEYVGSTLPLCPNMLIMSSTEDTLPEQKPLAEYIRCNTVTYWISDASYVSLHVNKVPSNVSFYPGDISRKKNPTNVTYDILSLNKPLSIQVFKHTVECLLNSGWLSQTALISAIIETPTPQESAVILDMPLHTVQPSLHSYLATREILNTLSGVKLLEAPNIDEVGPTKYNTIILIERL